MKHLHLTFVGILFYTAPIFATTIVPFVHLGECSIHSAAVVLAVAVDQQETTVDGLTYLDTEFQVSFVVKGAFEIDDQFAVRPHSAYNAEYSMDVAGDFVPVIGKSYLLWLNPHGAVWHTQMLSYYVYERMLGDNGEEYLMPMSGAGIEVLPLPDATLPEPLGVYPCQSFLNLLRAYANGETTEWNPHILQLPAPEGFPTQERALPAYCDFMLGSSTTLARWINPDANVYYTTNAPAGFNTTLNTLLTTMRASYTGIQPVNAGPTPFVANCAGGGAGALGGNFMSYANASLSGASTILLIFEDPCNEITNLSGCSGVLAMGGSYTFSNTHTYKEDTWRNAGFGYVVVNNGVPACYSSTPLILLLIHEMTHSYRMDHISTSPPGAPGQNMNPTCCNPISALDMGCMNYVYDVALPVELLHFTAQRKSERAALLSWKTATEYNNDFFTLERSGDGRNFEAVARIPAVNKYTGADYEWRDEALLPGQNYYRLSQTDFNGQASNLGVRSVKANLEASIRILPSPIAQENTGAAEIATPVLWEGMLEIINPDGRIVHRHNLSLEAGTHLVEFPQALSAGTYRAVLRNAQQLVSAGFSKL